MLLSSILDFQFIKLILMAPSSDTPRFLTIIIDNNLADSCMQISQFTEIVAEDPCKFVDHIIQRILYGAQLITVNSDNVGKILDEFTAREWEYFDRIDPP